MKKTLLRGWVWCRRFRKRCGYGVHSPADFFFITFVIYEKLPFYSYLPLHHLRRLVAHLPGHREKVDKLFFRLVNFLQPNTVLEIGTGSGMTARYMAEANPKMTIYTYSDSINQQVERLFSARKQIHYSNDDFINAIRLLPNERNSSVLFHIAHTPLYNEAYDEIINSVRANDCLVITKPYADKNKKKWWKMIQDDPRTGVTFDLYDIGIVFFDKKRIKENRIVNFL